jgi:hypothetical protein
MITDDVNRHGRLGIAGGGLLGTDIVSPVTADPACKRGRKPYERNERGGCEEKKFIKVVTY